MGNRRFRYLFNEESDVYLGTKVVLVELSTSTS